MTMRWRKLLVSWEWEKESDSRAPVRVGLRVEDRDHSQNVLLLSLSPDDVTKMLSSSVLPVDGQVTTADPRQIERLLGTFIEEYEALGKGDVGQFVADWAGRIARQVP